MIEPYERRFSDRSAGELPVLTGAAERFCAAGQAVRFAAGGEYRLLVTLQEQCRADNICLLCPGQTVLFSFEADTRLCDICFQGAAAERILALRQTDTPSFFTAAYPQQIADAACAAVQVPDGGNAALYRSAQLLRIFSCFAEGKADDEADNCGKRAMQYIRENYTRPINVNDIASAVGVSRSWLYRCFMDYAEQSPAMYLRDIRMQRAKSLLQHSDLSVKQIAQAVGYDDQLYFSRVFSGYFGCAPSAYRRTAM